jgi:transposase
MMGGVGSGRSVPDDVATERRAYIRDAYAANATLETMGRRLGVTRERVRQLVVKMGLPPRWTIKRERREARKRERRAELKRQKAERDQRNHMLVRTYASGFSATETAHKYGVSARTVLDQCRAAGVTRQKYRPKFDWNEARRMAKSGKRCTEIAKELGVHYTAVYRVVHGTARNRQPSRKS